jgi:hypothetical protein
LVGNATTRDSAIYEPNFYLVTPGSVLGPPSLGVTPKTPNNYVIFQLPAEATLSTSAKCIKIKSFYHACSTANVQGAANVPVGCNITMTSLDKNDRELDTTTITFEPTNPTLSNMILAPVTLRPGKKD